MQDKDDDREQVSHDGGHQREKKRSFVIKIPSYKEVIDTTRLSQPPPPSFLFTPSPSSSQAFNFIKNSEFYSPPPPPAPPPSTAAASTSRPLGNQHEAPSLSSSGVASSSTTSQIANNRNAILVSHRQFICSLRYHLLHPDYLYYRIRELPKTFKLRVVLCHVDVEDAVKPLLEDTKTALLHDCTLLCAWSLEECGQYLETIKVYENKPADIIQGQMDTDLSRLNHALTTVRHVNKTDVITLGSTFGTLSHIMDASMEDLARCPGIGEHKRSMHPLSLRRWFTDQRNRE